MHTVNWYPKKKTVILLTSCRLNRTGVALKHWSGLMVLITIMELSLSVWTNGTNLFLPSMVLNITHLWTVSGSETLVWRPLSIVMMENLASAEPLMGAVYSKGGSTMCVFTISP